MWQLRDSVEKTLEFGPAYIFDVSLPLPDMENYVAEVQQQLDRDCKGHRTWVFGHAGDGNLHLVVADTTDAGREVIEQSVYEPLRAIGGSISGEHGIGLEKRRWLPVSRSAIEIELMQKLKAAFDPAGILNPGRVTGDAAI
jgi:FAD/FMN-containing dehydrogenase